MLASCLWLGTFGPTSFCLAQDSNRILLEPEQEFSIKAAITDHPRQVLKNGKYFEILGETGALPASSPYGNGLYKDDTRYLSRWDISINGMDTILLSADCQKGYAGTFCYANKSFGDVPEQSILLKREVVITDALREKYTITNFHKIPVLVELSINFDADFADMFEVRGQKRQKRGKRMATMLSKERDYTILSYKGLDDKLMSTKIGMRSFSAKTKDLGPKSGKFIFELAPHQSAWLQTTVEAIFDNDEPIRTFDSGFATELDKADQAYREWLRSVTRIVTDYAELNKIIDRSYRDLYMLRLPTKIGDTKIMAVAAGIPWYAVPFGRDQIITAWKMLQLMPDMSRDVIALLAYYMGTTTDTAREEEPGRIMHELRAGEMARLKEIPFVPYYGTVDATPLFLILYTDYCKQTGDLKFAQDYWDKALRALDYLDKESANGEKYLVYGKIANAALSNQGWKDSGDSITNADGTLARPPIAVCEVQGYLYKAWLNISELAEKLQKPEIAERYKKQAARLKERFNKDFWDKDLQMPALALNGDGSRCSVVASNAGHLLFTGILSARQNEHVSMRLQSPDMFTGFGIRTLSTTARVYNPMSYHNGTVWPHDNCMIARGLIRSSENTDVLDALIAAAKTQDQGRLPELFCGFTRKEFETPLRYPVSCAPQAWAAATIPNLIVERLNLSFDPEKKELSVTKPSLPAGVNQIVLENYRLQNGSKATLRFVRDLNKTSLTLVNKDIDVNIVQK